MKDDTEEAWLEHREKFMTDISHYEFREIWNTRHCTPDALTSAQADEKLIRELVSAIKAILTDCTFEKRNGISRNVNEYRPAAEAAIASAQTRLGGEAPFETDNVKLLEDM